MPLLSDDFLQGQTPYLATFVKGKFTDLSRDSEPAFRQANKKTRQKQLHQKHILLGCGN